MATPNNEITIKASAKIYQGLNNFKAETKTDRARKRVTVKTGKF